MAFISNSITGSIRGNSAGTSSFSVTSSFSTSALSSSYALSSSFSTTASYAATASFAVALVNPVIGGAILSSSIPTLQPSGTLWFNTDDGNTYVQVSGSSGSIYVPAMASVAGSTFGATFRGSYTGSTWTVQHNLGTTAPIIQVYSGSAVMIPASIVSTDVNTSTITFASGSGFTGSVVASTGVGGATTASLALNTVGAVSSSFATTASFAQTRNAPRYISVVKTTDQTSFGANIDITYQTVIASNGLSLSGGTSVTLQSGSAWLINASFSANTFSDVSNPFMVVNIVSSSNAILANSASVAIVPLNFSGSTANQYNTPTVSTILAPANDTVIKFRCTAAGSGTATMRSNFTHFTITELI